MCERSTHIRRPPNEELKPTAPQFSIAAVVGFRRQGKSERLVAIPIYTAAALAVAGLALTFKAAPFMLSLRHVGNGDVAALQHAFEQFRLWGGARAVLQTLTFGVNLWSLTAIGKYQQTR